MSVTIHEGDCLDVLRSIPDGTFNTCITSPPYWGLRDYGVQDSIWGVDDASCEHDWGEPVASSATNHTDKVRWQHTRNGRDEEAPPEKRVGRMRTVIGHGTLCLLCGAWRGVLGLEPTLEQYVEHIVSVFREVRRVLRDDGTVWLNLGDSYAGGGNYRGNSVLSEKQASNGGAHGQLGATPPVSGCKLKDLVGIPWRVAFALQADGWWLRSDIIWSKPNPMPESVTDRPTRAHEYVFLLSKAARYFYDADAIREPAIYAGKQLGIVRGQKRRAAAMGRQPSGNEVHGADGDIGDYRNKRNVWEIATQPFPGAHFATFPEALVRPCILAGSPEGGAVLDPFAGSGTVGLVAQKAGRNATLIELSPVYCEMMRERLAQGALL